MQCSSIAMPLLIVHTFLAVISSLCQSCGWSRSVWMISLEQGMHPIIRHDAVSHEHAYAVAVLQVHKIDTLVSYRAGGED